MTDTKGNGALEKLKAQDKTKDKPATLQEFIQAKQADIAAVLPAGFSPEKMVTMLINAVRQTPALLKCDKFSFVAAILQAMALGLEPNTVLGHAYLIPYGGKVQFQIGYKGLLEMAYRTGQYSVVNATAIYKNDGLEYMLGKEKYLKHFQKPHKKDEKPVSYYADYTKKDGTYDFYLMTWEEIDEHRKKFSKAQKEDTPWKKDFDAMAKKTVLKYLLKYAEKSTEFARKFEADETVKTKWDKNMLDVMPVYETDPEPEAEPETPPAKKPEKSKEEVKTEPKANGTPPEVDTRPVTDKQLSRLFAIGHANNVEPEAIKTFAYNKYSIDTLKSLNQTTYDELVQTIEEGGVDSNGEAKPIQTGINFEDIQDEFKE